MSKPIVYFEVDDTLVRTAGTKRIPIVSVVAIGGQKGFREMQFPRKKFSCRYYDHPHISPELR
jgi:hypothetical protein